MLINSKYKTHDIDKIKNVKDRLLYNKVKILCLLQETF